MNASKELFIFGLKKIYYQKSMKRLITGIFLILNLFTIHVYSQINLDWAKSLPGKSDDHGNSIAVDDSSYVYITGYIRDTTDFDPGPGIQNLTSYGDYNIFLAKYDQFGNYLWAKCFGNLPYNKGSSITCDDSGYVYLTGNFSGTVDFDPDTGVAFLSSISDRDIFFAKYDKSGTYIWAKQIGGGGTDDGLSIKIDPSGFVYITGFYPGNPDFDPGPGSVYITAQGSFDIFFAKYDRFGNYVWAKGIGGTGTNQSYCLAVDPNGNIVITGIFEGTVDFDPGPGVANLVAIGNYDIFFAKYDSSGNYLWANSIGSSNYDFGNGISVDLAGNIYITGMFYDSLDFDPGPGVSILNANHISINTCDAYFAKYSPLGNLIWAKSISGTSYEVGNKIEVDDSGNVFIVGFFTYVADFDPGPGIVNITCTATNQWLFLSKYDSLGNYNTALGFGGPSYNDVNGLTLNKQGDAYITGYFKGLVDFDPGNDTLNLNSIGADIYFAKYSTCNNNNASISANGMPSICKGDTIILTASPGNSYLWSNSLTTQIIEITSSGNFAVIIIDTNGYSCISNFISVFVDSVPVPTINGINTFCFGDSVVLTANGVYSFLWNNSDTNQSIVVTTGGSYSVLITDSFGCTAVSNPFFVTSYSNPPVPVITQQISNLVSTPAIAYQWFLNSNLISNATNQTYTPLQNGLYTVQITDSNGCTSISQPFNFNLNFISEINNDDFNLYPNPTSGVIHIKSEKSGYQISIINYLCDEIINKTNCKNLTMFDIKVPGFYFVKIHSGSNEKIYKVICIN